MFEHKELGVTINFKKVCNTCPHRDTYFDENAFYGGNRPIMTYTVVGCNHEKVCKEYLDSED